MALTNKKWWKAALVRAIKTFAQTAGSMITVGSLMSEINWGIVGSTALVAFIYSFITSLAGIPEISEGE